MKNLIQNNNRMLHERLHLLANKLLFAIITMMTFSNNSQKNLRHLMRTLSKSLFSDNQLSLFITSKMAICSLMFLLMGLYSNQAKAQNCTTLYVITGNDGRVYSVNTATGAKTLVTTMTTGRSNLAVGPDPASLGSTVFTTSQMPSGSTVFKSNASIATTLPVQLNGLTTNPATTGTTAGFVYGISAARQLIKASPAPTANLGTITGDATWNGSTTYGDGFFNNADELFTVVTSGSSHYLYKINTTTLVATQMVQLSGSLPGSYHGIAFLNGKIYAGEAYTVTSLLSKTNKIQIYEINPNTGQGARVGIVDLGASLSIIGIGGTSYPDIDFATCDVYVPATGPTCNELFGIVAANQSVYRINLTTLATTLVTSGSATSPTQGNAAFGPVPANLNQNQFITSPNNNTGNIYKDVNGTGTLSSTSSTWGTPIGLGTDPATGIVYGINSKALTRWTGTGNGVVVGNITGDATWTTGTTLNDISVDAGGNLYCIVFNGANTYLYRINPTALTAKLVVQATGTFITNGTTTNGNGLAYMGDYFYYSRTNGANTDIWKISACTGGVSTYVGSVTGLNFGDLASCATVTCVPADFNFDCGAIGGGLQEGNLAATGASQTNVLRVPINTTITGLAGFILSGTGITTSPSPYVVTLDQGATFVDIPFTFNGSGIAGTRTITVTSTVGTGLCLITVPVDPCAAGTVAPILSASSKANICPIITIDLTTITASNRPVGATLTFHTGTPATAANQVKAGNPVPDSSAVPAGTYYAAFYDAINNCYSGTAGSATTIITATSNGCVCPSPTATTAPITANDPSIGAYTTVIGSNSVTYVTGNVVLGTNTNAHSLTVSLNTTVVITAGSHLTVTNLSVSGKLIIQTGASVSVVGLTSANGILGVNAGGIIQMCEGSGLENCGNTTFTPFPSIEYIGGASGKAVVKATFKIGALGPIVGTLAMPLIAPGTTASSNITIATPPTSLNLSVTGSVGTASTCTIGTNCTALPFPVTQNCGEFGNPCTAGTVAPALSVTTKSNICPATTIDLTTITATNTPVGTTLTFHTGTPATAANQVKSGNPVTDPAAVPAGTYYTAFYDATNNCYSGTAGSSTTAVTATSTSCTAPVAGTIDCSKTQIFTAPVVGVAGQKTLVVTINVTSPGCFTPITISGSGMTLANGSNQVCTTTTGIQTFSIPVNYDGTTLGTMNFTVGTAGNAGTCAADLTKTPKRAISDIYTLDCVPTVGPSLK